MLWINATVLLALMDDLRSQGVSISVGGLTFGTRNANRFTVKPDGRSETEIEYRPVQLRRLELYACAAVGTSFCPERDDDPWWEYFTSQVRDADVLVGRLRAEFGAGEGELR